VPWLGVEEMNVSPAGRTSVTLTPVAVPGPLLVSVTVQQGEVRPGSLPALRAL
jgi:hypothetical protein